MRRLLKSLSFLSALFFSNLVSQRYQHKKKPSVRNTPTSPPTLTPAACTKVEAFFSISIIESIMYLLMSKQGNQRQHHAACDNRTKLARNIRAYRLHQYYVALFFFLGHFLDNPG